MIKAFIQPFELNRAPLVRSKLVQLEEERHLPLIDMHHIITDGSSTGILIGDLAKIYQGADLESPQIHYKDYAVWHKEHADHQKMKHTGSKPLKASRRFLIFRRISNGLLNGALRESA